jgi:hypothetical protein
MMTLCSFCVEVCAGTRRIVQAGHALERVLLTTAGYC